MKCKHTLFAIISFLSLSGYSQQGKELSIQDVIELAITNSDEVKISEARTAAAKDELQITKNNQYPDLKISGQYQRLANANVDLQLNTGATTEGDPESASASPKINQLLLGQASVSMPIFSGFKLQNSIKASENLFKAAEFEAKNDQEKIALEAIKDYINLFKAEKTIQLIEENLKSTQQRVKDFTAMEQNGLLARNDLLKAQLQESEVALTLDEAIKNRNILNYKLAVSLKLPENTLINTSEASFKAVNQNMEEVQGTRFDLEALKLQEQASENSIDIAKANFYPSVALIGGYVALDLKNALTVSNAMNIGIGLSYNLSDIFKTKSEIHLAKSKAEALEYSVAMVSDKIKVQVENAKQNLSLAEKKYEVYQRSEEQANENFRIVQDKYDNGLQDTNDLLEADIRSLQAKINLTYSLADITQKYYELLSSKGLLINQYNNQ